MKEVNIQRAADEIAVILFGEIDSSNADGFFDEVSAAFAENPQDVRFNCENLNFIDSTTLGAFVKIFKRVKSEGKNMRLSKLQPKIKKLFTICALDKIMEIEE